MRDKEFYIYGAIFAVLVVILVVLSFKILMGEYHGKVTINKTSKPLIKRVS